MTISHSLDAVRERIGQVEKPTCALCGRPVASFTATIEPRGDGHYDVRFEVECCRCYEMVRLRGTCCQEEITALAIDPPRREPVPVLTGTGPHQEDASWHASA